MAVGTVIAAVGAAVQIYGQNEANSANARAERQNAAMYKAQQEMAAIANHREADIYSSEAQVTIGETVTTLAKAGVDMSGSALLRVANMQQQAVKEFNAIQIGAQINSQIIGMRAAQANQNASLLSSQGYNNTQAAGTILNTASTVLRSGDNSTSSAGKTTATHDSRGTSFWGD